MTGNDRDFRDEDLRSRFAALRREEEAQAPEFAIRSRRVAGRGRQRSVGKFIAVAACLITMVAAFFLLRTVPLKPERGLGQPAASVASLLEWRSPTDFLLETPGWEVLRTTPAIGVWTDHVLVPRPRQEHRQVRKPVLP